MKWIARRRLDLKAAEAAIFSLPSPHSSPGGRGSQPGSYRVVAALLLLALAALLLIPPDPPAHRISWDDLIAPLGVGLPMTRGFVLAPPRRGEHGDIVYVARRAATPAAPAARVEVHVLDRGRWSEVPQTRSFSIGWEAPPAGSLLAASPDDANAVRDALAAAIGRNDTGFASVGSIALAGEAEPPLIARMLDLLSGARGDLIGGALALALAVLALTPRGPVVVAVLLFALGLMLRAALLSVPFANDQDVQRLFTGGLPLRDILMGAGLEDRHPPFYFVVLHVVQLVGQSEAVGRAPAVLAGALAAPALLWATRSMGSRVGIPAVLAALALTVSPELIAQSRQVSEIPLFALMLLAAAASLVAATSEPRPFRLATIALSHAAAMYTYYLTPFVWAAHAVVLWWWRANRRVVMAFAVGILAGLPALVLGGVTLLRDWSARDVARAFPALAWGEHAPLPLAAEMGRVVIDTLGAPLLLLALLAIGVGIARGHLAVVTPAAAAAITIAGIALLSPIARVQRYYVTAVVPLIVLALAVAPEPRGRGWLLAWRTAMLLAVGLFTVPLLARARVLYAPNGDAFMPRFAEVIVARPESTVVTVAQYDKTILAYYLARAEGHTIGWHTIDTALAKRIEPLVHVHALDGNSESHALQRLEAILAAGPALVIERDALLLPRVVERLAACELLLQAPTARLSRCSSDRSDRTDQSDRSDLFTSLSGHPPQTSSALLLLPRGG